MENRKEIRPVLEYTNDAGPQEFKEGDIVICFAKRKIYKGTIVAFCNYKETENADPQCSVYLDTSNNNMSRSCEVINIADITFICEVPMGGLAGYPKTNENLDRDNFMNMIVGLGYDGEKADVMYKGIKGLISLYNIPLSIMLADVIQRADLNADGKSEEELIDIGNRLLTSVAGFFQATTDKIKDARIPY